MSIKKYWINKKDKEHNFIVFHDDTIYKIRVNKREMVNITNQLSRGNISPSFVGMPISYLRYIEYQENSDYIKLHYAKDSEDEIHVSDRDLRFEIFNYIKDHTPPNNYEAKALSLFKKVKKLLIALLIVIGIFSYIFFIINGLESGYEYEVRGNRPGIGSLVLVLAQLGFTRNALMLLALVALIGYLMIRRHRDKSIIHTILYKQSSPN